MTPVRQAQIWVAVLVALVLMLFLLRSVLLPFVAGIAIAYFLDPVADFLERRRLPRLAAVILITLIFFLLMIGLVLLVLPLLWEQAAALIAAWPRIMERMMALMDALRAGEMSAFPAADGSLFAEAVSGLRNSVAGALSEFLAGVVDQGLGLANFIALLFVTPVVSFYLLLDWDRILARIDQFLPRPHAPTIRGLAREIDRVLSGFARGTTFVCLILAAFYAVALSLAGLKFGLIVGLLAGFLSFIPFVGAVFGFVLAGLLALIQFWPDPVMIGLILGIFILGQIIEGNFLTPRLVGESVGLHPLWIVFALLAFGALFGFVGVLLAVPIAATLGVLVRHFLKGYLASRLYFGEAAEEAVEEAVPPAAPVRLEGP